jgi:hypothetical protein
MKKPKNIPQNCLITKKEKNKNSLKEFILEFFKNSQIKEEGGVMTISEVPREFEEFIGKKSPYKLVFNFDLHTKIKDSDLIMEGCYFMLAIRDYLRDKGQTNLLKIDSKFDFKQISKSPKLKNCKLIKIHTNNLGFLYEFSFLSTYQYLNDKKQIIRTILVKDKDILDLDIHKFNIQKGNKEEIPSLDTLEFYKTAKRKLDEEVHKDIKPIKLILKEKIDKELFRIKDHYFKQIKEKDEELETCANKIKMLKAKLRHTTYHRDISILNRMIRESSERLEMLKRKGYRERLKIEENFHIKDEIEKHVLSIKNKLINLTVFYYPIHSIEVSCKGKKLVINYDSVFNKFI